MPADPVDVVQVRALLAAATPGPWVADYEPRGDCTVWGPNGQFVMNSQAEPHWLPAADGGKRAVSFDVDRRDCALIAAAPALLAQAVDEVEALRGQVARVREVHSEGVWHTYLGTRLPWCETCEVQWPCPTVAALEEPGGGE